MSRWIDIDDDRNCYCGCDGEYEKWNIDTDVLNEAKTDMVERKKGKWDERSVFDTEDSDIAQMQSAKCSKCGRYHTTPYLYFFDDFNFCPNCGADMRGEKDE